MDSVESCIRECQSRQGRSIAAARQENTPVLKKDNSTSPNRSEKFEVEFFSRTEEGLWKKYGVPRARARSVCHPDLLNVIALRVYLEADTSEEKKEASWYGEKEMCKREKPQRSTTQVDYCIGTTHSTKAFSYIMSSALVEIKENDARFPPQGSLVGVFVRRSTTAPTLLTL